MTDQHPLTDEIIAEISSSTYGCIDDYGRYDYVNDDLRAAYDKGMEDQLEHVFNWLIEHIFNNSLHVIEDLPEELLRALRPTTEQENN